jgi:hypothetical protein
MQALRLDESERYFWFRPFASACSFGGFELAAADLGRAVAETGSCSAELPRERRDWGEIAVASTTPRDILRAVRNSAANAAFIAKLVKCFRSTEQPCKERYAI